MIIQHQRWLGERRILIVDEINHGSVQVSIPDDIYFDTKISNRADALIYALCVDANYRRQGAARILLKKAESEAKRLGCKKVALEWDRRESEEWTLRWYERLGYVEQEFGRYSSLLVKNL